jgi:phage repressor protein C with HTH and peptisase S24 domain
MQETIADRVRKLRDERNISDREVERLAGLGESTVSKLLKNPDQSPTQRTVASLARAFNVSESWLWTGQVTGDVALPSTRPAPELPARESMPNDVPVMGTAAGNHLRGAFKIGSDPVDWVRRPPALSRNREAYALYVEGSSMEPQFFAGDLIFINPNRPARPGDVVVVQVVDQDGGAEGTLGIYKKRTEAAVVIGKRNPASEVEIRRSGELRIHKVLTNNELFGV